MHTKTDSDLTSYDPSTPPRSPRTRPLYFVQSPSQHDADKLSFGTSTPPLGSPARHFYHCSPIHHSRESSTSRFSASLKPHNNHRGIGGSGWRGLQHRRLVGEEEEEEEEQREGEEGDRVKVYAGCFVGWFVGLFGLFSLVLWGASKSFRPQVHVMNMVFKDFIIQAGMDGSGVPTDMLSLNSTVRILYKNPATFFGVHVTSTPFELYYFDLKVATGQMKKFYQKRKSHCNVTTVILGRQIPLYGGFSAIDSARDRDNLVKEKVRIGLNLTFTIRSRAYILGRLVKSKFYKRVRCPVTLDGSRLGKVTSLVHSCNYR